MSEQFYALITDVGLAKITNGLINDTQVDFVHMAVGDGGGSYYNPSTSQTGLVREMWRGPVGLVAIDENDSNRVQIVSPIPPNAGGFFIREVGLFDVDGDLIVIAKHPETYKPVANNGSTKDLTIKLLIDVTNATSIVMKLDPTIITATREYVDNKVAAVNTNLIQLEEDFTTHKDKTATTTTKGHTQLSSATNSASEVLAATPKAIKDVFDYVKLYGLGVDTLPVLEDFNTFTKSGFYHAKGANRPAYDAMRSYFLLVIAIELNVSMQIALPYQYNELYYRHRDATGWTSWFKLIDSNTIKTGMGSPEGVITALPGTLYLNQNGGAGTTLYVKQSGTGNVGWVAK